MNKISALESYKVSVVLEDVSTNQKPHTHTLTYNSIYLPHFLIGNRKVVIFGHVEVKHG